MIWRRGWLHCELLSVANLGVHFRKTCRVDNQKKRAKGDPAALQLSAAVSDNFVGEEAPEARVGPRNPVGPQTASTPQILWARCAEAQIADWPLGRAYGVRRPKRP